MPPCAVRLHTSLFFLCFEIFLEKNTEARATAGIHASRRAVCFLRTTHFADGAGGDPLPFPEQSLCLASPLFSHSPPTKHYIHVWVCAHRPRAGLPLPPAKARRRRIGTPRPPRVKVPQNRWETGGHHSKKNGPPPPCHSTHLTNIPTNQIRWYYRCIHIMYL